MKIDPNEETLPGGLEDLAEELAEDTSDGYSTLNTAEGEGLKLARAQVYATLAVARRLEQLLSTSSAYAPRDRRPV